LVRLARNYGSSSREYGRLEPVQKYEKSVMVGKHTALNMIISVIVDNYSILVKQTPPLQICNITLHVTKEST
jgi:hypothetical protein